MILKPGDIVLRPRGKGKYGDRLRFDGPWENGQVQFTDVDPYSISEGGSFLCEPNATALDEGIIALKKRFKKLSEEKT